MQLIRVCTKIKTDNKERANVYKVHLFSEGPSHVTVVTFVSKIISQVHDCLSDVQKDHNLRVKMRLFKGIDLFLWASKAKHLLMTNGPRTLLSRGILDKCKLRSEVT